MCFNRIVARFGFNILLLNYFNTIEHIILLQIKNRDKNPRGSGQCAGKIQL